MKNWVNWMLVISGVGLAAVEVMLGAVTGFDLALLGASLVVGGTVGLVFGSTKVGLFTSGAVALVYFVFLRRYVKSRLMAPNRPSNVDALPGRSGVITERVAPHAAGMVRLGDEIWRATLADPAGAALEAGTTVTVESVEGVTLRVR